VTVGWSRYTVRFRLAGELVFGEDASKAESDKRFGEQRATDCHEWTMTSTAVLMDERRGHLFARSALPRNQNCAVAVPDDAEEFEHGTHPRAVPDDNRVHGNWRL
jgi:hypothetical protein